MATNAASALVPRNLVWDDRGFWCGQTGEISYSADAGIKLLEIEDGSFWFRHRNECICAAMEIFPPTGPILDIGGGNGFVARRLTGAGFPVALLEPIISSALAARDRGVEVVICATLSTASFAPASIPAVGMFDVLEHLEDDVAALQKIYEILCPRGYAYLTVPAYSFLYSDEDISAGHFRRYGAKQLRRLFHSVGFEISYLGPFFAILPSAIWLTRTLPSRLRQYLGRPVRPVKFEHLRDPRQDLNWLWRWEVEWIRRHKRLPFGGSFMAVIRKPTS